MPRFAWGSHDERRLAIRATRFVSEADFPSGAAGEQPKPEEIWQSREKRGSFEGAIRIPLHASSFFFNDLVFLVIPRKSLKFLTPLFSIPTAPIIHPFFQQQLSDLPRRQKAVIRASRVAPMAQNGDA